MVHLVIKNPSQRQDFELSDFAETETVGRLKEVLAENYPGRPSAATQKLIFAGRLLRDTDVLAAVFASLPRKVGICFA